MRRTFARSVSLALAVLTASTASSALVIARRYPVQPPLPRAYVTDGLPHYWDAEFNASRTEHDSESSVWKDLVGGKDLTMVSDPHLTWTAHSAKFNYTSYWSPARTSGMFVGGDPIPFDEIKTVEVCAAFSKGYGDSLRDVNVIFSNGATERGSRWGSELGDRYSTAPYYVALSYAAEVNHVGAFARICPNMGSDNIGLTVWNDTNGTRGEGMGATFQSYVFSSGFTASTCVTNYTDVGGFSSSRFRYPTSLVTYWGYYGTVPYTNNNAVTYGLGGAASGNPYLLTDPVGTGLSVGGVMYSGRPYSLFYGYIYASRVYNRRLEAWEKARNAEIDYATFHGKKE